MSTRPALLDTSVLIARGPGRSLKTGLLPEQTAVSVVTIGELQAGVLAAADTPTRSRRLSTLEAASAIEALPVTTEAARRWAELKVRLAGQGRRAKISDLWIVAIAAANGMDIATQDGDFDVIEQAGGPSVIRV